MKPDTTAGRSLSHRALVILGLVVTVASSAAIEVSLLLLLTTVPVEVLRVVVLGGIVGVAVGCGLLWLSRPMRTR